MASELEMFGAEHRLNIIANNLYNIDGEYNTGHPNALADKSGEDDPTNVKGKGTGGNADALNTIKGGSFDDVSVRNSLFARNVAKFGYGPETGYEHPDTDDGLVI